MPNQLIELFIKTQPFKDDIKNFLIDIIKEEVDTKSFDLYDPENNDWHPSEASRSIESFQDLSLNEEDLFCELHDWICDFVCDLPRSYLYLWMAEEDKFVDDLMDKKPAGSVYQYYFKNRFETAYSLQSWTLYDIASNAMIIYIFNEICDLFEEHFLEIAKHFGEKNWYDSEMYQSTLEPPIKTLADVGMSQKDFI